MTVTILIPIYNVEKYIAECAESLFSQTYQDIEYVFCDDCTPDNSISLLQGVLDKHPERKNAVRIVKQTHNKGLGGARVRLVAEVHSEAFFIADSDDILPINAIEILVKKMEETGKDIVDGAHADYYEGKTGKAQLPFHGSEEQFLNRILCQNVEKNRVWGRLYKADVLKKLPDMFFEGIDYAEDYCAVARLAALTSRAWTDAVVYLYRTDNVSSYTQQGVSKKNLLSYLHSNNEVLRFYRRRGHLPFPLEIGMLNAYRVCHDADITLHEIDENMKYAPEHIRARVLYTMLRSKKMYFLGNILYKICRTITCL